MKIIKPGILAVLLSLTLQPSFGDGKFVYDEKCSVCHGAGIAGAPKFGDAATWENRIAKGMEVLYQNSINGFFGETGAMPAKGGFASLSDEEVKAAVDYMVENSK